MNVESAVDAYKASQMKKLVFILTEDRNHIDQSRIRKCDSWTPAVSVVERTCERYGAKLSPRNGGTRSVNWGSKTDDEIEVAAQAIKREANAGLRGLGSDDNIQYSFEVEPLKSMTQTVAPRTEPRQVTDPQFAIDAAQEALKKCAKRLDDARLDLTEAGLELEAAMDAFKRAKQEVEDAERAKDACAAEVVKWENRVRDGMRTVAELKDEA